MRHVMFVVPALKLSRGGRVPTTLLFLILISRRQDCAEMSKMTKGFEWGSLLREEKLCYWGREAVVVVYESIAAELVRVI